MVAEIKRITLYKIKPNLSFDQFLVGDLGKYDYITDENEHFEAYIKYVDAAASEKNEEAIPWLKFLNSGFSEKKYKFKSSNHFPRAIMAIKFTIEKEDRYFVATFGQHADSLFEKARIVHDFGIRVGMNICDTERLRRVQTSVHEAVSRQTERQASTGANLRIFGINTDSEFLRTISGYVHNDYKNIIESFRGRDSIAIKLPRDKNIKWSDLVTICNKLDERYYSDAYRQTEFRIYDILRHENDPEVISELDRLLCDKLIAKDFNKIHLSPPEFIESEELDYAYTSSTGYAPPLYEDLRIEDLIATPGRKLKDLTSSRIHSWQIYIYNSEEKKTFPKWHAYECLVAEIDLNTKTYILSNGQWREVSQQLKQKVTSYFTDRDMSLDVPYLLNGINIYDAAKTQNREEVYNRLITKNDSKVFLFDKAKINIAGQGLYEICDLFHSDKHFVHVKRYTSGASSISHIFTQTKLYSHAFATDEATRNGFTEWIDASTEPENMFKDRRTFKALVPLKASDVDERAYTVIFCILHDKDRFCISSLPFMSQYELMLTHKFLTEDRRYKVAVIFRKIVLGT